MHIHSKRQNEMTTNVSYNTTYSLYHIDYFIKNDINMAHIIWTKMDYDGGPTYKADKSHQSEMS